MPDPPTTVRTIRTDLLAHPAVMAWRRLHPEHDRFDGIEVLKEYPGEAWKSVVYRLERGGPGDSAIIAKRCQTGTAALERMFYEDILPCLPLPSLRFQGSVKESERDSWLFLEDAGEERYSSVLEEHRSTAARWLALLHTSAARVLSAASLPDRGPGHYLGHLRGARETIRRSLPNPGLTCEKREALKGILHRLDRLESCWSCVERCCEQMPRTFVHGDFVAKNLRLRRGPMGMDLLVFDWEQAGLGVPASDLAQSPPETTGFSASPEVEVYWRAAQDEWPGLDLEAVRRMADWGTLFRSLAAMDWEAPCLGKQHVEYAMSNMKLYESRLADGLRWIAGHA